MAPVHLYLAAWVLGGVLLGASMLLDAREPEAADAPLGGGDPGLAESALTGGSKPALAGSHARPTVASAGKERGVLGRTFRVFPLGLIGFGLSGLLAKGLEVDLWPWTFTIALSIGFSLIGLGYRLSGARSVDPSTRS
jgi:hypothetical protein